MTEPIDKCCDNCSRTFNVCEWPAEGVCMFWAPDLETSEKIKKDRVTKLEDK